MVQLYGDIIGIYTRSGERRGRKVWAGREGEIEGEKGSVRKPM